jgi:hypothetical protein
MKTIAIVNANEKADICTPCGGQCCKWMSGAFHPHDLSPTGDKKVLLSKVKELLSTGDYKLTDREYGDEHRGYFSVYLLVPATSITIQDKDVWASNYGRCVNLTETGCKLNSQDRPLECKAIVPDVQHNCKPQEGFRREDLYRAWMPYKQFLLDSF